MAPVRVATFSVSRPATKYGLQEPRSTLVSRKPISRSGASRKSSAWRVGGVSSTTRSKRVVGGELEQLLHRHVLVAARERGRDLPVEAVLQDAAARGLVAARGARRARRTCAWCRASCAHSSPAAAGRHPPQVERASASSESCCRPRLVASRREGSIVQTSTRRPAGAACRPSAAAVVVLPTPPAPPTTRIRRSASACAQRRDGRRAGARSRRLEPRGQHAHRVEADLLVEQERQADGGSGRRFSAAPA